MNLDIGAIKDGTRLSADDAQADEPPARAAHRRVVAFSRTFSNVEVFARIVVWPETAPRQCVKNRIVEREVIICNKDWSSPRKSGQKNFRILHSRAGWDRHPKASALQGAVPFAQTRPGKSSFMVHCRFTRSVLAITPMDLNSSEHCRIQSPRPTRIYAPYFAGSRLAIVVSIAPRSIQARWRADAEAGADDSARAALSALASTLRDSSGTLSIVRRASLVIS